MKNFRATERINGVRDGRIITVRAADIETAAQHAVNRLVSRRAISHRCTGDPGGSGIFQGYVSCQGSGVSNMVARGPNIHVSRYIR